MYYAYHKDAAPEALLARYPKPPLYANGNIVLFGESISQITGIELTPEQINSYIGTKTDESYMAQLAEEAGKSADKARTAARKAFRAAIKKIKGSQEIRITSQQGKMLHDDWIASQPQTTGI
jgi:hypothetical protein